MTRHLSIWALLAVAVISAGCQTTSDFMPGLVPSPQPAIQSMPKEYIPSSLAIGKERDINNQRVQGDSVVRNAVLEEYLNGLLNRIKEETGIPNLAGTVYVTSNQSLRGIATPDGNIFVGIGLLKNLKTEAEVVALLAHELAHIIYGHHQSDTFSHVQKRIQQTAAIGADLQARFKAGGSSNVSPSKTAMSNLRKMQLAIELSDGALLPAWSRKQENEADALAIDLTTRMGYSYARGLKSMLELMDSEEGKIEKKRAERTTQLQAQVEQEFKKQGKLNLEEVFTDAWTNIQGALSSKHDDAAERGQRTADYYEEFYEDAPIKRKVGEAEWKKVLSNPTVAKTVVNYERAHEAYNAYSEKDLSKALRLAREAASAPTADDPFILGVLAIIHKDKNDKKALNKVIRKSMRSPMPSWQLIEMEAENELLKGDNARARRTMEQGFKQFKEPPNLQPKMIEFYSRIGDTEAANKMKMECAFATPDQREKCSSADNKKADWFSTLLPTRQ